MRFSSLARPSEALASHPRDDMRRVNAAILALADDQHPPGSKKLQGAEDLYRIRIGDYRVIYAVEAKRWSSWW